MPASSTSAKSGSLRLLVGLAAFVIVVAGMKAAASIVVPFLLAVFIAIIVTPIFVWLQQKGLPSYAALGLIIVVLVGLFLALVGLVGSSLTDFTAQLPEYQETLRTRTQELLDWLRSKGVNTPDRLTAESLNPAAAMGFVGGLVSSLSDLVGNSFLIVLTVIFILFEASAFPAKLAAIAGRDGDGKGPEPETVSDGTRIIDSVRHYVAIKTMVSALTGVLITIGLAVLGVKYALLWGLLAFLLNYVPNIGSIIAAVPAVVLALVDQGLATAGWVAVICLAVNMVVGNVIEPRVMGRGLGLSTLVVFLSLVFWGWVLGPVGMLLSVPLTMTAKIVLESRDDTRWIAVLLGARAPDPGPDPSAA